MICKNADLFAQLDQKYVEKIIRKRIRCIRHCPDGATSDYLSWQKVFHVSTKRVTDAFLWLSFCYFISKYNWIGNLWFIACTAKAWCKL